MGAYSALLIGVPRLLWGGSSGTLGVRVRIEVGALIVSDHAGGVDHHPLKPIILWKHYGDIVRKSPFIQSVLSSFAILRGCRKGWTLSSSSQISGKD